MVPGFKIELNDWPWERSLNLTSTVDVVDVGSSLPSHHTLTASPQPQPQISRPPGAPPLSWGMWALTINRPRWCITKTSDDFRHRLFHFSLCFGADNTGQQWHRCKNEATRWCGGPIDNTEGPKDNVEGPMMIQRAHLQCRGPVYNAKDPPTQWRAHRWCRRPIGDAVDPSRMQWIHRGCGGPLDSAEDPLTQWMTPWLSGGPVDSSEDPSMMRRTRRAQRPCGGPSGPINNMQDPSTIQRGYRRCRGPSEDAGANDRVQGSTMSSTAWTCAFSLFFFSLKNYIHVPKHIPKEGLLLGEQLIHLI